MESSVVAIAEVERAQKVTEEGREAKPVPEILIVKQQTENSLGFYTT